MLKKPLHIPKTPGVYIFRDARSRPLYIGKAGNLRSRLAFYFSNSPKPVRIEKLMTEARNLEMIRTVSDIDALITEAEYIKKHLPKYNVLLRDDKNYFYIAVTKEKFPRIYLTHQPRKNNLQLTTYNVQPDYIGPFTDGSALKITLRMLRRVFPYCTCAEQHKRPCLNSEIGKCLGFCCYRSRNNFQFPISNFQKNSKSQIQNSKQRKVYKKNIRSIVAVLKGRGRTMIQDLKREMKMAAKIRNYEKAAILRDQVHGLERIFEHAHILSSAFRDIRVKARPDMEFQLQQLLGYKGAIERLEGYDISNISGASAVGSMVVVVKKHKAALVDSTEFAFYSADRQSYRQFRIKTVKGANDVAMHKEVLRRRFAHPEWQFPDIIVIDGGKPQLEAAITALNFQFPIFNFQTHPKSKNQNTKRPLITALAKRKEELYVEGKDTPIELQKQPEEILHLFQRIRDESHRFAKRYHHKRREILYRQKIA